MSGLQIKEILAPYNILNYSVEKNAGQKYVIFNFSKLYIYEIK